MRARWGGWLASVTAVLCAAPSRADDTAELQSLLSENVITTASSTAERASAAPATSVTISAEDLRMYGIHTVAEAVNFLSLGVVTGDPLRVPDIGSRGVLLTNDDGKHFLLQVNGHAINDPLYGAAHFDAGIGIPLDMVDHIEVVVGPGSVLYGSNAMMGVINVITKGKSEYKGVHVGADFEPGRSYRLGAGAGIAFKLFGNPSELTLGVDYYERFGPNLDFSRLTIPGAAGFGVGFRRGGPGDGTWGGTVKDGYFAQAPSGMLRLRSGDFELNVLASVYRRGIPYSTATTEVDFDDTESYERDRSVRVDLKHQATLSSLVQLTSRIYGDALGYQRRVIGPAFTACTRRGFETCTYHDVGMTHWAGLEERLSLNWLHDSSLVTMLGIDVRGQWAQTKQDNLNFDTGAPLGPSAGRLDAHASVISPYLQQTYSPTSWLDLNAGARLDIDSRFSPVISPRGAIALRPAHDTTFKAIYSEAFRAPTWSETDLANYRIAPSVGLQPETVRSVEASLEQRFATHRVLFGVFRSWWSDLVASEALSNDERNRLQAANVIPIFVPDGYSRFHNVASIDNVGWNGGWEGTLGHGRFRYGTTATGTFTRRDDGNGAAPLAAAPQLFGNVRVAYAFGGYLPTPALAVSYMGPRLEDRARAYGLSPVHADAVAEIRLTFTGLVPGLPGLSYRATGAYTTAAEGPYIAGPQGAIALPPMGAVPSLAPAPIDRLRAMIGLQYDWSGGSRAGDMQ